MDTQHRQHLITVVGNNMSQCAGEECTDSSHKEKNESVIIETKKVSQTDKDMEVCAQMLTMYTPLFKSKVAGLSNKALRRLINALIEYPLNEKEYNHREGAEQDAFTMGNQLLQAKFLLMTQTIAEAAANEVDKQLSENNEVNKETV